MITGELRNQIDKLWTEFWTGGITNPLTVIEQISFLMFARLLDITETRNEKKAERTKKPFKKLFDEKKQDRRWSHFKNMPAQEMLVHVRDKVFPEFKKIAEAGVPYGQYMKDAQLLIQKPNLLVSAVNMVDDLPLTEGDSKGDLYEYLLSKLTTAGINGQFRTPRHIIRKMVEITDPKIGEVVGDPACGTGGFLVGIMEHLLEKNTSTQGIIESDDGKKTFTGDMLKDADRKHIRNRMFHGFDFDGTMLRIAVMNLLLHGIDAPEIHYQDTMSNNFTERFPKMSEDFFDVILANPPFKGSLDFDDVHPDLLRKVKTKKTELLFVVLILKMMKIGGRSATIVPDGVLFGSSNAHLALREMLVDDNQLEAVISLPSGVFKPYAGVSTGILVFTKGGKTKDVFYYDVQADGFSLDDKRTKIDNDDLPDLINRWQKRNPKKDTDRTGKAFFVPADEIRKNKYDLSINRYKEIVYEEDEYDPPKEILARMKDLEMEIMADMDELEGMLG
ncbi:SAM-dependent methyltransferase [Desulfonema limicola]|uniref:site-specific DNA-methyltransferase (adenine-specific) n=1 Tax=Desulfonema limicola TaxID=45656 RepID=A0A975B8A0_9BACT|nr:class I SAM-dependent DNA methyltransferase [Desulfonema limicola]QTA80481.1 SAM-dependent methyltransferase [Desulfonema limicola]